MHACVGVHGEGVHGESVHGESVHGESVHGVSVHASESYRHGFPNHSPGIFCLVLILRGATMTVEHHCMWQLRKV